jgi:hypothetical protein
MTQVSSPPVDSRVFMSFGRFAMRFLSAGAITWDGPWQLAAGPLDRRSTIQTGGPDDDDESALVWKLVALDTILVLLAAVFGV